MSRKKTTYRPVIKTVTEELESDFELLREYRLNDLQKEEVDYTIKIFHDNNNVLNHNNKYLFNELYFKFTEEQILYFVDKIYFPYFMKYLNPRNFLTTYFLRNKIIKIYSYKYKKYHNIKQTKEFEDYLESLFTQDLLSNKPFYEANRLEDDDFKNITEKVNKSHSKLPPPLPPPPLLPPPPPPPPPSFNPYSKQNRKSTEAKQSRVSRQTNIAPKLYNCINPPPSLYTVKNNEETHFKNLMLCEENPVENPVNNIVIKKPFGGCGSCGGIITGKKKRKFQTLKKKKSLYVKTTGGYSCNQNGGFIANIRSSKSKKSNKKN